MISFLFSLHRYNFHYFLLEEHIGSQERKLHLILGEYHLQLDTDWRSTIGIGREVLLRSLPLTKTDTEKGTKKKIVIKVRTTVHLSPIFCSEKVEKKSLTNSNNLNQQSLNQSLCIIYLYGFTFSTKSLVYVAYFFLPCYGNAALNLLCN